MGLRARLTQLLSLVGKTLLSDTIPEPKTKRSQLKVYCVSLLVALNHQHYSLISKMQTVREQMLHCSTFQYPGIIFY